MIRDYDKEYKDYHGTDSQKKRRASRNRARKKAMDEGTVKKGDSKEVHHTGSHRTGSLESVPTRVVSKKYNRSQQPSRGGKK